MGVSDETSSEEDFEDDDAIIAAFKNRQTSKGDDSESGFDDDELWSGSSLTELGEKIRDLLSGNSDSDFIYEYNLSTPFDISTKTYAGNGERCEINHGENDDETHKSY